MKAIKLILVMTFMSLFSVSAYSQFAVYHSYEEERAAKNAKEETVYGYISTSDGWVRISLKIKQTDRSILVVGYKPKDTSAYGGAFVSYGGSNNNWKTCNSWAEAVSVYSDGKEINNNFDYKVYISALGKYVYF